jgi:secreted trypsin-like serine protease
LYPYLENSTTGIAILITYVLKPCFTFTDIRVVGGILAELNEFPWMAALVYNEKLNGEQKIACGGSLISPNVIMTAAHCIPSKNDILSNYELTKIKIGAR